MNTHTIDRGKGRGHSTDEPVNNREYRPFDRDAAASLVDAVRRAMPGCDAVTGLRAARTLATLRNHPARAQAFADYLNIESDGTMAPMSRVPDPYLSRKHSQRADDSVWRYGMARVQGLSVPSADTPSGISDSLAMRMLEDLHYPYKRDDATGDLVRQPRNPVGRAALDIYRLTQLLYGDAIEPLLSTDVAQKRAVVHSGESVDPYDVPGVLNRHGAVCTLQTWRVRTRLHAVRLRNSEQHHAASLVTACDGVAVRKPRNVSHAIHHPAFTPGKWDAKLTTWRPRRDAMPARSGVREWDVPNILSTEPSDRMHIGNMTIPRGKLAARKPRQPRQAKVARTIAVKTLDTIPQVFNAVATLNRGERLVITYKGSRFTITRGKGKDGKYAITPPAGKRADGIRTAETVARKVGELVA